MKMYKVVDMNKCKTRWNGRNVEYIIPTEALKSLNVEENEPFEVYFRGNSFEPHSITHYAILKKYVDGPTQTALYFCNEQELKNYCNKVKIKKMIDSYNFNPESVYQTIYDAFKLWANNTKANKFVVGISGGKDSTVVAALLVSIFGKERVHGVLMPQGTQSDIHDSFDVVKILGISHSIINIGESVSAITKQIWDRRSMDNVYPSKDMEINLPARIRMSTLHAIGQCIGGRVINTSNLSEDVVGYATQFGDNAGAYAPIQGLTVTEVKQLGKYVASLLLDRGKLGDATVKERIPDLSWATHPVDGYKRLIELIDKTPADGLQAQSDEERLGITYKQIDDFIRFNKGDDEVKEKIRKKYKQNKFKLEIVQMPQPDFSYLPNFVKDNA